MENCNCSCRYLFIIAFNVGGDSGLAMVSAERDSEAIQILRNSGKYNGHPLDYVIRDYKKLGEIPNIRSELLLESYNNALGAYELLESTVKWLKGEKGDKGDTVIGAPAGFGNITATVDSNVGIPSVDVFVWGPDTAKNFTFNFHNLKGGEGSGGGSSAWGNIGGDINDQTDLITALNTKLNKVNNPITGSLVQLDSSGNLVSSGKSVNDFIEQESDPTVPSWAKQENKPSYNYSEILNTPTIPTALADLSDDSTHRLVTDTEKTAWSGKQAALESGVNIKTINNESILGSGNITIQGGGGGTVGTLDTTQTTAQSTNASESLSGSVKLHKISKTGTFSDLISTPTTISGYGITDAKIDQGVITLGSNTITPYVKPANGIPAADIASGVIPSVPTISTDIAADATSDTKTTSPKAVKTFVENKGYTTNTGTVTGVTVGTTAYTPISGVVTIPAYPSVPVTDVTVGGSSVVSSGTAVIPAVPTIVELTTSEIDTIWNNAT